MATNVAVVAALVLVLGQLTPAAASGVCGSGPNLVSPSGNVADCVCDGGYEPVCVGDDPNFDTSGGSSSSSSTGSTGGYGGYGGSYATDCSTFETDGYDEGNCVSFDACTSCCVTCAAECATAGIRTGNCTACETGERRALSSSMHSSATRHGAGALPGVDIVAALVALTARVWLLCGDRQVQGGAGRRRLQQLSCECRCDSGQDGV